MPRFDSKKLYDAMNKKRIANNMSWQAVSREIGVSAATITHTKIGGRMEVDGMLAMVSWLDEKVENFIRHSEK